MEDQISDTGDKGVMCELDGVFKKAAALFAVLSTSIRLRIIRVLCLGEKNASQLVAPIGVDQPTVSRHLNTMFKSGILEKRRHGTQMFYRIADEKVVLLCRAMCTQVAVDTAVN